jgi:hypothetical protein
VNVSDFKLSFEGIKITHVPPASVEPSADAALLQPEAARGSGSVLDSEGGIASPSEECRSSSKFTPPRASCDGEEVSSVSDAPAEAEWLLCMDPDEVLDSARWGWCNLMDVVPEVILAP